MGFWVKSLSDKSPRSVMSAEFPIGGNAIWLHCLKLVLTSFGFAKLFGMKLTSTSFPCTQFRTSDKAIICNEIELNWCCQSISKCRREGFHCSCDWDLISNASFKTTYIVQVFLTCTCTMIKTHKQGWLVGFYF